MSIKKFGQDGEYHHFFHKKKFLLLHFLPLKKQSGFVIFCSRKNRKKARNFCKKMYYIPRTTFLFKAGFVSKKL